MDYKCHSCDVPLKANDNIPLQECTDCESTNLAERLRALLNRQINDELYHEYIMKVLRIIMGKS